MPSTTKRIPRSRQSFPISASGNTHPLWKATHETATTRVRASTSAARSSVVIRPARLLAMRHPTPRASRPRQGYAFDGNSMSSVTTLSPSFQGNPSATRFKPQLVFGRNAISAGCAPTKRAALPRVASIIPYQLRQSAAPRSRTFSTCAVMASATRRGSGATAAWFM